MIQPVRKVSNPLTIIAIFAGLAEVSGTVVLPFLADESQDTFVWFLMIFPFILVLLFFVTLNFNHAVLYAPSDFKNEDNFIKLFGKPTAEERRKKISEEIGLKKLESEYPPEKEAQSSDLTYRNIIDRSAASTHYLAEELVITKLAQEFDEIEKEVMLRSGRSQFLFDAIGRRNGNVYAIEVKYAKDRRALKNIRSSLTEIAKTLNELPRDPFKPIVIMLALATDLDGEELESFKLEVGKATVSFMYPQEVRVYNLASLEKELVERSTL